MRRAADLKNLSKKRIIKNCSGNYDSGCKDQAIGSYSSSHSFAKGLYLLPILLLTTALSPSTDIFTFSNRFYNTALAESGDGESEVQPDKRPVRIAPDGTEIVDYISELEQSNDALEQQIRSLKEQLARQNGGSTNGVGDGSSNQIKERDILGGSRIPERNEKLAAQKNESHTYLTEGDSKPNLAQENKRGVEELRGEEIETVAAPNANGNNELGQKLDVQYPSKGDLNRQQHDKQEEEKGSLQSTQQRYIAPALPVIAEEEPKSLSESEAPSAQNREVVKVEAPVAIRAIETEPDDSAPVGNLHDEQARAGLSFESKVDSADDNEVRPWKEEQQSLEVVKEDQRALGRAYQESQGSKLNEELPSENDGSEYEDHSPEELPEQALINDPTVLDAKKRVRTDVSTLISLLATREQLFRRFGAQGGQIQVSPSRLVTQRGQTVESVRARQEQARTLRDWKLIEADLADLRKIAEKDISFIRRYSRRSSN